MAGDLRAYEIIYQRYGQPLLRVGLRMLGRREDAEDAVQTTFLKLSRGLSKFQFDAKFSTYLFRIMMNVCFDAIRKRTQDKNRTLPAPAFASQPVIDLRLRLDEAIRKLPERMRACFVLFAVEDQKQSEIADILNLRLGTVKANIFQAKARLRRLLADAPNEVNS
jgi:RNA polymerase sigma-70 factor (ECF subfamily)